MSYKLFKSLKLPSIATSQYPFSSLILFLFYFLFSKFSIRKVFRLLAQPWHSWWRGTNMITEPSFYKLLLSFPLLWPTPFSLPPYRDPHPSSFPSTMTPRVCLFFVCFFLSVYFAFFFFIPLCLFFLLCTPSISSALLVCWTCCWC